MSQQNRFLDINNQYGNMRYYKNDQYMIGRFDNQEFFEQEYIIDYLSYFIVKSNFIIDVGAHVGSHTVLYKKINPTAIIYSFEPQRALYKLLCYNVSNNSLENVYSYNNAVGEDVYDAEMNPYSTDGENSMSSIEYGSDTIYNLAGIQIGSGGEKVKVVSLDALKMSKCDFIKIDVEGYEPNVLIGARDLINRCKPTISFEMNYKRSPNITESSIEILENYNYDCHNLWEDNWIAIPKKEVN